VGGGGPAEERGQHPGKISEGGDSDEKPADKANAPMNSARAQLLPFEVSRFGGCRVAGKDFEGLVGGEFTAQRRVCGQALLHALRLIGREFPVCVAHDIQLILARLGLVHGERVGW
jgi:hypothetical protein